MLVVRGTGMRGQRASVGQRSGGADDGSSPGAQGTSGDGRSGVRCQQAPGGAAPHDVSRDVGWRRWPRCPALTMVRSRREGRAGMQSRAATRM